MVHRCAGDQRTRLPLSRHFATTNCCLRSSFSATSEARERSSPTTNCHRAPSIIAVGYQSELRSLEVCAPKPGDAEKDVRMEKVASTPGASRSDREVRCAHHAMVQYGRNPDCIYIEFARALMTKRKHFVLTAAAAVILTACAGNAPANNASAANTAAETVQVPPTKDALVTRERSAYEAWKSKDAKFWDTFLSEQFVGYGPSGKLDKASATKGYTGAACEIKSYALSDEQMRPLDNDAVLITHKLTVDGTCGGQKVPAISWTASVYVRDGNKWKGAFHAEAPVVDPKSAPPRPADQQEAPRKVDAKPAAPDGATDAMLALETTLWEAWRTHEGKRIGDLTAKDISFINIFGTYFATKADALKDWTGTGCDVRSVSVTDATGTMLSPTAGILTFNGTADGTCYGQKFDSVIWGTSVYVKQGDVWRWAFGINLPGRRDGI